MPETSAGHRRHFEERVMIAHILMIGVIAPLALIAVLDVAINGIQIWQLRNGPRL